MIEYAVYKGEELLVIGTAKECAEELKVDVKTIKFYATPIHFRRTQKRKNPDNCLIAVRLDE